jgi:peptide/nickel transport system substrate-binding protein
MSSAVERGRTSGMTGPSTRRRAVLAALGSGTSALAGGCLRRARTLAGWQSSKQVQLRIKTLPADADPYALQLARAVAEWFRTAGIDAGVVPMAETELLRQILLRNEFGLFVVRLPARFHDPDALYTLLHSRFADAPGWQNPFGYTNLDVDELLETQRRTHGERRRDALAELQLTLARTQPFTLLAVPDDIRAARTTTYTNWRSVDLRSPLGYLLLDRRTDAGNGGDDATLRIATTDRRATTNLNPLSAEYRRDGVLTGLLYDPLAYASDGELVPWLAESWGFPETPHTARVSLRDGVTWHDGEPLTSADVAFTYELLADTALGRKTDEDAPVPSPRFRGRSSLVGDVRVVDDSTVEIEFVEADPGVGVRAFTVPVLPKHVWRDRTDRVSLGGIDFGPVPEALVTNNIPPVGSGPFRFVRNTPRESLVLERFDGHFLNREEGAPAGSVAARVGTVPFEQLSVRVVGVDVTGVEMVADGEADVTGTSVGASTVPRIGRSAELDLLVSRSNTPYVLGYNARRTHLSNPRVRNTLARLVDGEHLTKRVLDGYGRPAVGPLAGTRWYPEELDWSDGNPMTPFLGGDGAVDERRAREAFREIGYRYDHDRLVGRNA